jgi:hypothetical protein
LRDLTAVLCSCTAYLLVITICAHARLLNDTGRVESELIKPAVLPTVISLFCTAQQAEFEKVVEELYAMMQKSTLLVKVCEVSVTMRSHHCRLVLRAVIIEHHCCHRYTFWLISAVGAGVISSYLLVDMCVVVCRCWLVHVIDSYVHICLCADECTDTTAMHRRWVQLMSLYQKQRQGCTILKLLLAKHCLTCSGLSTRTMLSHEM